VYVKEYKNEAPYKGILALSDKYSSGIEPPSPCVVLVFAGVFSKAAHKALPCTCLGRYRRRRWMRTDISHAAPMM
jgi:hypothetical protein